MTFVSIIVGLGFYGRKTALSRIGRKNLIPTSSEKLHKTKKLWQALAKSLKEAEDKDLSPSLKRVKGKGSWGSLRKWCRDSYMTKFENEKDLTFIGIKNYRSRIKAKEAMKKK